MAAGRDMFDTMVITKAVAGFCGALLIFLLGTWLADTIYMPYGPAPVAFAIDIDDPDADVDEGPAEDVDLEQAFAAANPDAGDALWRQCRACHSMEPGVHGVGPSLHGKLGAQIAAVPGFNYSGALQQLGDVWTLEALDAFIANPRGAAPGTTMGYAGMRSLEDRMNLIAWIERESQ
jgi:cytochrome c